MRERVDASLQRLRFPDGPALFTRGHDALLALGGRVGAPDRSPSLAAHLARPLLAVVALGVVGLATVGALPARVDDGDPGRWLVVALLAAAVLGTVLATRTVALVALVGVTGLFVSLWLLLSGALDVAITLLLVEVLPAVVLVLVLRGGPRRLPDPGWRRWPTAVLAVAVGLVAAGATAALTGRRELSAAGTFFLDRAEELTGGTNVVNTVLVDFRGLARCWSPSSSASPRRVLGRAVHVEALVSPRRYGARCHRQRILLSSTPVSTCLVMVVDRTESRLIARCCRACSRRHR